MQTVQIEVQILPFLKLMNRMVHGLGTSLGDRQLLQCILFLSPSVRSLTTTAPLTNGRCKFSTASLKPCH